MTIAALTLFLGSFLLFGIQPMLGRTLLPNFGGTAAVWTTCLATYQTLLLAGYFYAHKLNAMPIERQRRWHQALLGMAIIWTALLAALRPALQRVMGNTSQPALEVVLCVLLFAGLPYTLLSANSTLIQAWLARAKQADGQAQKAHGIYRLYGISNLGSLLGLLVYPLLLEPFVPLKAQWWGFAMALAGYATLLWRVSASAMRAGAGRGDPQPATTPGESQKTSHAIEAAQPGSSLWLWLLLPLLSVFLLNAVTTHLTLDVMPLPLLWVVLLGLFLLSYVLGFSRWSAALLKILPLAAALGVIAIALTYRRVGPDGGFALNLGACLAALFCGCTFLHAWLYSLRPATHLLTKYYLYNALGGAVGGLSASLLMPLISKSVVEFPVALMTLAAAVVLFAWLNNSALPALAMRPRRAVQILLTLVALASLGLLGHALRPRQSDRPTICRSRGFFGTLKVLEAKARAASGDGVIREFVHGNTVHGIQALLPGRERMPTTYFTAQNGGYAILGHPKYRSGEPMRVNILGLGVGVMLAYARTNDYYRCYEISPEALRIASDPELFTFVSGCPARLEVVAQDARKGLETELTTGVEPYDVIQIDAFTGDNLPYHLSTREAFELYFKMLKPDGILAVNISNWHLQLEPFVRAMGDDFQCPLLVLSSPDDFATLSFAAKFAFFCRQPAKMGPPPQGAQLRDMRLVKPMAVPRDELGSFVGLVKW